MKRNFRLGPATTLAIAGAIVFTYVRFPTWQREAQDTHQIQALRAQVAHQRPFRSPLPQSIEMLLKAQSALHLSPVQRLRLERLSLEEERQTGTVKRNAQRAGRAFEAWMQTHQSGVTLPAMQQQYAIYSATSAPWSRARERFWSQALLMLTPAQRAQIQVKTQSSP